MKGVFDQIRIVSIPPLNGSWQLDFARQHKPFFCVVNPQIRTLSLNAL